MAISCVSVHFMSASPLVPAAFPLVVDRVLGNLDGQVRVGHLRLARQARVRLEAPRLVEHVLLLLARLLQRIESLAHDHVAGGAGGLLLACMLDVDVIFQQRVAYGDSLPDFQDRSFRRQRGVRKHLQLRHQRFPIFLPESARRTPWSMRRWANSSVARLRASTACLMARASVPFSSLSRAVTAWLMASRSFASRSFSSWASAESVASRSRWPSTRY